MIARFVKNMGAWFLLSFVLALISCKNSIDVLHILTDKTELAIATEMYAGLYDDVRVTLKHVPYIDANTVRENMPDLVIGEDINSMAILKLLAPIEPSFSGDLLLTGPKNAKGKTVIIPLAYKLPIIIGRREVMDELPDPVIIRSSDIRAVESSFVRRDKHNRLTRLGFSPSWNPASYLDLLWLELRLTGKFFEGMNGFDTTFAQTRTDLTDWIVDSAGDLESDIEFTQRYHYLPHEILLEDNKIRFARIDYHTWITMPGVSAKNLDIRYFSGERTIPIESVTWGGLLQGSKLSQRAEEFLNWLLSLETQQLLIERWKREGLTVFGFLDGLSSIPEVNQTIIIERFPSLQGMVPESHYLTMQRILPDRWAKIRDEVIIPWFTSALYSSDSTQTLSETYAHWDLSSLDTSE